LPTEKAYDASVPLQALSKRIIAAFRISLISICDSTPPSWTTISPSGRSTPWQAGRGCDHLVVGAGRQHLRARLVRRRAE
jgi:hypothetical protein